MSLSAGTKIGTYEIVALLGAGGMGEVYRARDTRLKREVAIKVLPDAFASDPDRLARFQREAELLATLNHPNIGAVYGVEQTATANAIVLELIEGETLADRIQRGAIPVKAALAIALQIAEALEAAHERGVIHRDLKPANIKITPDDKVKVLDFGLAKALESNAASATAGGLTHSPTLSMMGTQAGVILGTAAYMSPEQAKGFPADQRSDVFAFGTVLYEMLTGRQPFSGDTAPDVLASVIVRDADLNALPPNLNPRLRELIERCLEKNPKKRWQAIGDVRAELEKVALAPHTMPVFATLATPQPLWKRVLPFALAALAGGVMALAGAYVLRPAPPIPAVSRSIFTIGEGQTFTSITRQIVAISPDSTKMVYVANLRLFLRHASEFDATPIRGTEGFRGVINPVFSPDGQSIAFGVLDGTLKRISVAGGAPVTICKAGLVYGLSWEGDDLFFGQGAGGIMRVSADGGNPEQVVKVEANELAHGPQLLPDRDTLLFTMASGINVDRWESGRIVIESLKTHERKTLITGGSDARYLPTGHLVYALSGVVYAVPFDATRLVVTGGAVPVLEGVSRAASTTGTTGTAQFALSQSGTLMYIPGPVSAGTGQRDFALLDRAGNLQPLKLPLGRYVNPRVSPDGKRLAFEIENEKETAVWIYDLAGTTQMRRLTFGGHSRSPAWSRDSQRIAYQSSREGDLGIFWQRADGTGPAERLTRPEASDSHHPDSWAPSGDTLLFTSIKSSKMTLWTLSLRDRRTARIGSLESDSLFNPAFSPDGRWLAYTSGETGTIEVFVQPFPGNGTKFQVSKNSGHDALWAPNGREIVYDVRSGYSEVVSVTLQPVFTVGVPAPLPRATMIFAGGNVIRPVDMAPDGRIVGPIEPGNTPTTAGASRQIHVVQNWFEELKQRVPVRD